VIADCRLTIAEVLDLESEISNLKSPVRAQRAPPEANE